MKRAVVLQHAPFEGPGRIAGLLQALGYSLQARALDRGDAVPQDMAQDDVLIVMGGPMGVGDRQRPECAFLQRELELLQRRIAQDAPVLGVCLGAQLLAAAAGAPVHLMTDAAGERCYEVGWGDVRFLPQGSQDPLFAGVPEVTPVLHWHGDMFQLPTGARLLASSERCRSQAFILGSRQFGLQFHCEVDAAAVEAFLQVDLGFVERAARGVGGCGAQRIRTDTQANIERFEQVGDRLLSNILVAMTAPARGR